MPEPTVSVVVPAYNAGPYVREALDSILTQGVEALQVIVIDDGSSDETPDVLAGVTHPAVEVVRTANQGVAAARNAGLDRARGRYLAFLDADDRWRPGKLRREMGLLEAAPDMVAVFSNFVRFDGDRTLPDQFRYCPELDRLRASPVGADGAFRIDEPAFEALVAFGEVPGYTQTMMFRRAAIADLRFRYPLPVAPGRYEYLEDMDFCLRAFRRGAVGFIRDPLVEVRRHGANLTRDFRALVEPKLRTLTTLAEEDLTPSERRALRDRTARAWLAAGGYRARRRRVPASVHAYWRAAVLGHWRGALRGVALLPARLWRGLPELARP